MQVDIWQKLLREWPEHEALLTFFQVVCHGIPDQRPLQNGDIVNVDVSAYYKGFHGDLNETFVVGNVDDESKKLIRVTAEVRECAFQLAWLQCCTNRVPCRGLLMLNK